MLTDDIDKPAKCAQPDDLALLVGQDRKSFLVRLKPGLQFHTHRGMVAHDDLIGSPWGRQLSTHLGYALLLLKPSTDDIVLAHLKRNTQIIYPKESGYILMKMGIKPGCRVIEAGTGSGALTLVLAQAVGPAGHVYSYEERAEMQQLARKNLEQLGLADAVTFRLRDIKHGFDECDVDALFLDVPNPWDYLAQVHVALSGGGFFASLLPTTNQVSRLIGALEKNDFGLIEVEELLLRQYKAVPARLRPMDRMVAHTGYLVFARALIPKEE
ncbi:MAG TPA: tRNA (adenine-N1)-methyltransferase [Chloroflexi bacterium]|nr:tRNA (adenine-N1)-methyltransferase [Chloroflexota bacterium]